MIFRIGSWKKPFWEAFRCPMLNTLPIYLRDRKINYLWSKESFLNNPCSILERSLDQRLLIGKYTDGLIFNCRGWTWYDKRLLWGGITISEQSTIRVWGAIGRDIDVAIQVYIGHASCVLGPIFFVVLDDTKRIDPEVTDVKAIYCGDGVSERQWQALPGNPWLKAL